MELVARHDLSPPEEPGGCKGNAGLTEAQVSQVDHIWVGQTAEAGDPPWTMQVKIATHPHLTVLLKLDWLVTVFCNIVQKKRAALTSENVNKLVCFSDWLREKWEADGSVKLHYMLINETVMAYVGFWNNSLMIPIMRIQAWSRNDGPAF